MRILVLTNLYPPHYLGGYELICQTVVETLRARGHAVRILTSDHRVATARGQEDDPQIERSLRINGLYGHPWLGIRQLGKQEAQNNRILTACLQEHQPDLVYVWNMGGLSKSMLFTLQRIGLPTVFYISDHWISRGLASDVWLSWWNRPDARLVQRAARGLWTLTGTRRRWQTLASTQSPSQLRFRRIYFCSRALRDSTAAAGFAVEHGAVIHAPVHQRYLRKEACAPRNPAQRLLYVGRLAEDKGVMTALRALDLLRGKFSGQLSIYGQGEAAYVAGLRNFAQDKRLPVSFAAAGSDQMPSIYRNHDLLLFTSEWAEPFALTPIEAMACGLPVIGTTTGGSAELFRDRENGLTYTAGDAAQLADRILEFITDDPLRARCASTAFTEARQRFAAPVIVDQIEDYLEETLQTWGQGSAPLESKGMSACATATV